MVQDIIDRDLGSLVDERRFRRTDERDEFGRRKWPEEKVPIAMESIRGFNVRAQIVGPSVPSHFNQTNLPGLVRQAYLHRNKDASPNQRAELWLHGNHHGPRSRRTHVPPHNVPPYHTHI
jgi:hypothetical protein